MVLYYEPSVCRTVASSFRCSSYSSITEDLQNPRTFLHPHGPSSSLMSNVAPAAWDVTTPEPAQSIAQFIVDVTVNSATSITCVTLPFFDPASPVKGAKAARESFIKMLSGKCDDFNPLSFRSETERDRVTPDPYFKFAPHWSTLSGGRTPYITRKPADIARMCVEVSVWLCAFHSGRPSLRDRRERHEAEHHARGDHRGH